MASIDAEIEQSHKVMENILWPNFIRQWCGDGVFFMTDIAPEAICKMMDYGGVDAVLHKDAKMHGIACRVQYDKPYRSFTIRKKVRSGNPTEWDKLHLPGFTPTWHIQAYLASRAATVPELVLMCKTEDLRRMANNDCRHAVWDLKVNGADGNEFAVFWANKMVRRGAYVWEWPANPKQVGLPL